MIKPTVGRVVWYRPAEGNLLDFSQGQPLAAIIAHVHSDTLVNLAIFDANGQLWNRTSVVLVQEGDPVPTSSYCEWMPYQKSVAKGETAPVLHAT